MRAKATKLTGFISGLVITVIVSALVIAPETNLPVQTLDADADAFPAVASTGLQPPAGPAINQVDTNSKSEVQRAYLERFERNRVRVKLGAGSDLNNCEPGTIDPADVRPAIEAWNFLRGLNGLNAVQYQENGPIEHYLMAAAMVSAKNNKLSHLPKEEGFACATEDAQIGANHANLAQSLSQNAAEIPLWYYMDYSAPDYPVNDKLGHRLFMMDPQLKTTAMGAVQGYTAFSVRTGVGYPGVDPEELRDRTAPTPKWMSWPSKGFFPKQLLTSVGQTSQGMDVERWSFSIQGADLSNAQATITGPDGNEIPVTVTRPGQPGVMFTPRSIAEYSTLLMKFAPPKNLPKGQETAVYKVRITGIEGNAKSEYSYDVILFDPLTPLTDNKPLARLVMQPLTGVGYKMTTPIEMEVSAWPEPKMRWQIREDFAEWKDIPGANGPTYLPEGAWDVKRAERTQYRLVASNVNGEFQTPPVKIAVQGLKKAPGSIKASLGASATFEALPLLDENGENFDTKFEWQAFNGTKWETLSDDGHFSGTRTTRLTINRVTPGDQGLRVRMVVRSKIFKLSGFDVVVVWTDGTAQLTVF